MDVRGPLRAGAIAGAVTIFLALVGLIGRFEDLILIGEQVTFARLMLVISPFVVGYAIAGPRVERGERLERSPREALIGGAVVGAVAGAVFGVAVVFTDVFGVDRIRSIFINVTENLLEFVTFGQSAVSGALILVAVSAVAGATAGLLRVIPADVRRPITAAVSVTIMLAFLQRIIPIALDELNLERDWLYSPTADGLTWVGAAVVAGVTAGVSIVKGRAGGTIRRRFAQQESAGAGGLSPVRLVLALALLGVLLVIPYVVGPIISEVLGTVLVFALLAIGLNIVVGYAGLLDLGYVFFFAVGAYSLALLTGGTLNTFTGAGDPAVSADLNFYVAVPIVMLLAAGAGLLIGAPVLRLRGDYLALVTLGLGEMVTVLVASPWLVPLVGGPNGMSNISDAAIGGFGFGSGEPQHFYYLALAFVLFAMFVSWRLINSRIGRAWTAMREDEQTADAMGISTTRFKLLAFSIGGAVGSLGGALFAVKIGSITPASFQVLVSIQVLGIVILGGIGSLPGVVVGSLVLVGLPGLLREFEEYRLLAYGAAVVAVMLLRPEGLVPNVRRSRELHAEEVAQDQWVKASEEAQDGGLATEEAPA